MSQITLIGNLTNLPELRVSQSGAHYTMFTVATSDNFKDKKTDEWKETGTVFHNIILFNKQAENFCNANLVKGTPLVIVGRYKVVDKPEYTNTKTGEVYPAHSEMGIVVEHIAVEIKYNVVTSEFKRKSNTTPQPQQATSAVKPPVKKEEPKYQSTVDDDLFGDTDGDLFESGNDDDLFA